MAPPKSKIIIDLKQARISMLLVKISKIIFYLVSKEEEDKLFINNIYGIPVIINQILQ